MPGRVYNSGSRAGLEKSRLSNGLYRHSNDTLRILPQGQIRRDDKCVDMFLAKCDAGQRSIAGKCEDCLPGMYGNISEQNIAECYVCPHGKCTANAGSTTSCSDCDPIATLCFASAGASSGTAKIPSSVRFPSFVSASGELPILERSALGAESRTSASIHTPEIEYATQYIIMSCCAGLALVLILVHRLLPERIKGLDLAFAGSHYIDDGHAIRMLETRLGATCTLALVPIVGMLIVFVLGAPNKAISQSPCWGGLCPVDIQPTIPVPGFYGGMTIVLRAFAASPSAPCRGGAGGFLGQDLGENAKSAIISAMSGVLIVKSSRRPGYV